MGNVRTGYQWLSEMGKWGKWGWLIIGLTKFKMWEPPSYRFLSMWGSPAANETLGVTSGGCSLCGPKMRSRADMVGEIQDVYSEDIQTYPAKVLKNI